MKKTISNKTLLKVSSNEKERICIVEQVVAGLRLVTGIDPNEITVQNCKQLKKYIEPALRTDDFRDLMEYLEEIEFSKKFFGGKYLTKENAAAIFICARRVMLDDIPPHAFNAFCKEYAFRVLDNCRTDTIEKKAYDLTVQARSLIEKTTNGYRVKQGL